VSPRTWRIVGVCAAIVVAAVVFLLARGWGAPPPLNISYDDIAKVQVYPLPEGSAPPPLVQVPKDHERPLAAVRSDIPSPFPAPAGCQFWDLGGDGVKLSVWLNDGHRLDYPACAFPGALRSLYEDAWH
jgi:hypothetical protein